MLPLNNVIAQGFAAQSTLESSGEETDDESFTTVVKNEQDHICEFSKEMYSFHSKNTNFNILTILKEFPQNILDCTVSNQHSCRSKTVKY